MFKSILKKPKVITSYYDKCIDPNNCVSCKRKDLLLVDVRGLVGVDDLEGVDDIDRV